MAGLSPTSKNVAALFMRGREKLGGDQREYLGRLCDADGFLADAHRLTQDFAKMVRDLKGEKLEGWIQEAEACDAPALWNFTVGLRKDLAAVRAGLTETWSNGPVEGFVNKLKLLKRGLREGGVRSAQDEDASRLKTDWAALRERMRRFTRKATEPEWTLDAIEALNAGQLSPRSNRQAATTATALGLPEVCGSDSHHTKTIGYADACNLFPFEPAVVVHKLDVLARHCEAEDRDPASIEKP